MLPPEGRVFGAMDDVIVPARLRSLSGDRYRRVSSLAGLFLLAGVILLTGAVRADVDVWGSIGPTGGNVFVLAIDPHAPATIYAGTGGGVPT